MTKEFAADRLDVKAFAQAAGTLEGHDTLLRYERLAQEARGLHPDLHVDWTARAELRNAAGGSPSIWLWLDVQATLPMECQRCLTPVDVPLQVQRWFRFVADEATAEAQDEDSEEDLLVISREFNLRELIEDELLMALPVVPRHDECPQALPLSAADEGFEAANEEKPNPFAALASLKLGGGASSS